MKLRLPASYAAALAAILLLCAGTALVCFCVSVLNSVVYTAAAEQDAFLEGTEATLAGCVQSVSVSAAIPEEVIVSALPSPAERQIIVQKNCAEIPSVLAGGKYSEFIDSAKLYEAFLAYAEQKSGTISEENRQILQKTAKESGAVFTGALRVFDMENLNLPAGAESVLAHPAAWIGVLFSAAAAALAALWFLAGEDRRIWFASVCGCAGAFLLTSAVFIAVSGLHGVSIEPIQLYLLYDGVLGAVQTAFVTAGSILFACCAAIALYGRKHKIRRGMDENRRPDIIKDKGKSAEDECAAENSGAG